MTAATPGQAAYEAWGGTAAGWNGRLNTFQQAGWETIGQAAVDAFLAGDSVSAESIREALAAQEPHAADGGRSFEDMLADPREQFDLRSELLASISEYAAAPPVSAGIKPWHPHGVPQPAPELAAMAQENIRLAATSRMLREQLAKVRAIVFRSDTQQSRIRDLVELLDPALAAQEPHAADGIPLRSDAETAAMLRADLADAEAQLARWPRCPAGCSCRIGIEDDPDRNECGCDGPRNGGEQPAPELAALREQVRLARQDRDQLRTAVLDLAADLENEAAHTLSREAAEAKRAAAQQLRKIAEPA